MKFRRAAPATLIVSVIVVTLVSGVAANRMFSGMTGTVERSELEQMEKVVTFNLKGAAGKALARAELIADLPATRRLLAAKDGPGLLAEYGEMFQIQKDKHEVDQAQFILPPATSLVRLDNPAAPQEDLSKFRPLIVSVDRTRLSRSGMSISRGGPAIFAVVPVHDDAGNHIGIFEVGIDVTRLLDNLKGAYGFELGFYVEEELLREVATGAPPEIFDEANRTGRYLRFHATDGELLPALVKSRDLAALEEPVRLDREVDGVPYGLLLVPVRSPSGTPLGVIAVAKDFSGTRDAAGRSRMWQLLIAGLGIVLLAVVVMVVVRSFLVQPLRHIVAGRPFRDDEVLCDELRDLSRMTTELRGQADAEKDAR